MKREQGAKFNSDKVNLAELERRTGISRAKLRRIRKAGFVDLPHALTGRKAGQTLLTGFTGIIDELLLKGVTNSSVCYDRLRENGFQGGLTIVKEYIASHKELIPPKRLLVAPQGSYLCPERRISFDGFVHYDGRRFGVPYWYTEKTCRVKRDGYILYLYDSRMTAILTTHDVTWSRRDSFCKDQYVTEQPEETPTAPVKVHIQQLDPPEHDPGFNRFNFEEGLWNE